MELLCISQDVELVNEVTKLVSSDYDVKTAENFIDCMEVLNFHHPDVVLVDLSDPSLPGIDMIDMFPKLGDSEYMPLIGLNPCAETEEFLEHADFSLVLPPSHTKVPPSLKQRIQLALDAI